MPVPALALFRGRSRPLESHGVSHKDQPAASKSSTRLSFSLPPIFAVELMSDSERIAMMDVLLYLAL
jgi:hypothetical protein